LQNANWFTLRSYKITGVEIVIIAKSLARADGFTKINRLQNLKIYLIEETRGVSQGANRLN